MVNAAQTTANPLTATPSVRRRFPLLLTLFGFYSLIAFATPILTDTAAILLSTSNEAWNQLDRQWMCGCAILIAGWVALGPGRTITRALQGLFAAVWFLIVWMLGMTMSPNWKPQMETTVLSCAAIAGISLGAFVILRCISGKVIARTDGAREGGAARFQYSLTTLLVVMLLVCVLLSMFGWIDPRYRNPANSPAVQALWNLGLMRQGLLQSVADQAISSLLIAAVCMPLFLRQHASRVKWGLGFSVIALIVALVIDVRLEAIVQIFRNYHFTTFYIAHMATVAVCLLTAASALHGLGYWLQSSLRPPMTP